METYLQEFQRVLRAIKRWSLSVIPNPKFSDGDREVLRLLVHYIDLLGSFE
jgi:hypothetical protein